MSYRKSELTADLPLPVLGRGYSYVILFSDGTVKVGAAKDLGARFSSHKINAEGFGFSIAEYWTSIAVPDYVRLENRVLSHARSLGGIETHNEWFQGVTFEAVRAGAERINVELMQRERVQNPTWRTTHAIRVAGIRVSEPVADLLRGDPHQLYSLELIGEILDIDQYRLNSYCQAGDVACTLSRSGCARMTAAQITMLLHQMTPDGDLHGEAFETSWHSAKGWTVAA